MQDYIESTNKSKEKSKTNSINNVNIPINSIDFPDLLPNLAHSLAGTNNKTQKVFTGPFDKNIIHMREENFNENYDVIGKQSFSDCNNLESIVIPDGVKRIEFSAFAHLKKLKRVIIPDSVEIIESYAFYDCPELTEVRLSENLTTIKNGTFAYCKNLKNIKIPDSVRRIESFAFESCSNDLVVTNVSTNTQIDPMAFPKQKDSCRFKEDSPIKDCFNKSENTTNNENSQLIGNDKKSELKTANNITETKMFENLEYIGKEIFDMYPNLSVLDLSNSKLLKTIDKDAFIDCRQLEQIILPPSLKEIGSSAFAFCNNLKIVDFSNADFLTLIGARAFFGCQQLREIKLPRNLEQIEKGAFHSCFGLVNVDFSNAESLKIIGEAAFFRCQCLKEIKLPSSLECICKDAFHSCFSLVNVDFSNAMSLNTINEAAFELCNRIMKIKMSPNIKKIDKNAFALCNCLNSVDFSEVQYLKILEFAVFGGCKQLTNVKLPSNLEEIGEAAFAMCTALTEIDMSSIISLKKIGYTAFRDCSELTTVILPPSLKVIESGAFGTCSKLKNIELPNDIEIIGGGAFQQCESLKKINLPKILGGINPSAFLGCENIKFDLPSNLETINAISDDDFEGGDKFCKDILPLYINGKPQYYDVTQSYEGDCTLLSFLASLAKYQPEKIMDMIHENEDDETVTVTLYPFGVKKEYTITKLLPDFLQQEIKCIWFRMIQKAVACALNYGENKNKKIDIGQSLDNVITKGALSDIPMLLFGKPSICFKYGNINDKKYKVFTREYEDEQLNVFSLILSSIKNNNIITFSIDKNDQGLYSEHAYSVLGARMDEAGRLLIKIRNPHNRSSDRRYYTELYNDNYTLIQEPYLYDDPESGPTPETQAETELDFNILCDMSVDFRIGLLNGDGRNNLDIQREKYNTINELRSKSGLNFYDKSNRIIGTKDILNLKNVYFIEDVEDVNFDKSDLVKTNHLEEENVIVPDGVTAITYKAFTKIVSNNAQMAYQDNDKLKSIVLSSSVRNIDKTAFNNCINLKKVDCSKAAALKTIDNQTFKCLDKLSDVILPDTLKQIGNQAFCGCVSLHNINFPSQLSRIGNSAFYACNGLQILDLSNLDSLETLENMTFSCCVNLRNVIFPGTLKEIGNQVFCSCYSLQNINLPPQLRKIGEAAFAVCVSLQTADLSNMNFLEKIEPFAFHQCLKIKSIKFPKNLKEIEKYAFNGCSDLTDIDFTEVESLHKIGDGAFSNLNKIHKFRIRKNQAELFAKNGFDVNNFEYDG